MLRERRMAVATLSRKGVNTDFREASGGNVVKAVFVLIPFRRRQYAKNQGD